MVFWLAGFKDVVIKTQNSATHDVNSTETGLANVSLFNVVNNQHCPQCGGLTEEVDGCKEGSIAYVWFECVKADCDDQWLQPYTGLLPRRFEQTVA